MHVCTFTSSPPQPPCTVLHLCMFILAVVVDVDEDNDKDHTCNTEMDFLLKFVFNPNDRGKNNDD